MRLNVQKTTLLEGGRKLSRRELEIARWFGTDTTYAEIAVEFGIRPETVRVHARNILRKLGVRTRHAAVAVLLTHPGAVTTLPRTL